MATHETVLLMTRHPEKSGQASQFGLTLPHTWLPILIGLIAALTGFEWIGLAILVSTAAAWIGAQLFAGYDRAQSSKRTLSALKHRKMYDLMVPPESMLLVNQTLGDAAMSFLHDGPEVIPVVTHDGLLVGVVPERILLAGLSKFGVNAPVSEFMQTEYVKVSAMDPAERCFAALFDSDIDFVVVEEEGQLAGLVNQESVNRFVAIERALGCTGDQPSRGPAPATAQPD